jgi:hypothetical protein
VTCNTTDKSVCAAYEAECAWSEATSSCAVYDGPPRAAPAAPALPAAAAGDEQALAAAAGAPAGEAAAPGAAGGADAGEGAKDPEGPAGASAPCGAGRDSVACAVDEALSDAAASILGQEDGPLPLNESGPKSGAAGRAAGAAAATAAALAAAALLLL